MAIKGAEAKLEITNKILELFPGSFKYDKEIRIPVIENGEEVQIKISLTAAKVNVERDGGVLDFTKKTETTVQTTSATPQSLEPTEEEKNIVNDLISKLGL